MRANVFKVFMNLLVLKLWSYHLKICCHIGDQYESKSSPQNIYTQIIWTIWIRFPIAFNLCSALQIS